MNASVIVLTAVATLMQMLGLLVSGSSELELNDELINRVMEQAVEASNWGYLLAIAMGLVMLLLWKKPSYFRQIIFVQGKKMTGRDFLLITVIFLVDGLALFCMVSGLVANGLVQFLQYLLFAVQTSLKR